MEVPPDHLSLTHILHYVEQRPWESVEVPPDNLPLTHRLLGLEERTSPRFVKRYAHLGPEIRDALRRYADDVRSGAFPQPEHTYSIPEDELELFEAQLQERGSGDD